ncbi:MAG: O-antigen ligase family protein [Anaerolineae bacterium]|jgi:hypothetical protein|nr:O-antigen ligase family protein [Anaerolineae bacterium]
MSDRSASFFKWQTLSWYLVAAAVAIGAGLIVVLSTASAQWMYWALVGLPVVVIYFLARYPIAPYLIFPLTAFELMYVTVAGVNVRPHQAVTLLTIAASLLRGKVLKPKSSVAWACIAYLFVNGISIAYSYSRMDSVRLWLLFVVQAGTLYALMRFLDTPNRVRKFMPFFLFSGFVLTMVGLVQVLLVIAGVVPPYRDAWMIPVGRPPGTFVEAAWLADFSMFFLLVFIPYLYSQRFARYRPFLFTAWFLMLLVNLVCMARAAWLGLLVGISLQLILMLWLRPGGARALFNLMVFRLGPLLIVFGLLFALFMPDLFVLFVNRFLEIGNRFESAASLRVDDFNDVMKLVLRRPWTGYGIGTLATVMHDPTNNPRNRNFANVSLNMYLTMLFDAGIPGLVTGFLVTMLIPGTILRNAGLTLDPFDRDLIIALGVGLLVLVVTFQFSNGFPRGWYWAMAGISLSASHVLSRSRSAV